MDLEQESCKIRKILASSKSWHGFGTDFLPTCQILKRLGKILQDIFDRDTLQALQQLAVNDEIIKVSLNRMLILLYRAVSRLLTLVVVIYKINVTHLATGMCVC